MSSFPWFWYGVQSFVWLVAMYVAMRQGWRQCWGLISVSVLYFLYNLFVPVTDWFTGVHFYFGFDLSDDPLLLSEVGRVYAFGAMAFLVPYVFTSFGLRGRNIEPSFFTELINNKSLVIIGLMALIWSLILWNLHASGISLLSLFSPGNQSERDILFSAAFFSSGIDLLTNCLPTCLFLLLISKPKQKWIWIGLFVFWLIFSLLAGWRYRIILLLLMILGWGIRHWNWSFLRLTLVSIVLMLSVTWLTLNRMAVAKRQFHLVTNDLSQFDFQIFTQELSNSRTFHATLQYIENQKIERGGFSSWAHHVFNKFRPKSDFKGGERPKPWILNVTKDWIPPGWPYNPNPAVSQMEEFYLTFGWLGLVLGMGVMGILVALMDFRSHLIGIQILQIILIALTFQWISRGFFLFQAQISLAVLLPFAVVCLTHAYLRHEKPNQA